MVYTGLELFMDNLKRMIYSDNHALINDIPSILSVRPQLQLLYEQVGSMIQILFVDQLRDLFELEEVRVLKKRFKDAVEEAQDIIDLFVSAVVLKNRGHSPRPHRFMTSLNLEDVMGLIESIKGEFMTITFDKMKTDSSPRIGHLKTQSDESSSCTRTSQLTNKASEDIVVGLDRDVEVIRDKLVEDQKQLDFVSIVGMGGLGKTTLATKVFNDRFVMYHFEVRAWVTVSQAYEKRDLLIQILQSIGIELDTARAKDSELFEMLHKSLKFKRYLIVIDDIWSTDAWNTLKRFFYDDRTKSRILLTSRIKEVVLHAKPHGFIHQLEYLTEAKSWELLRKKVFHHGDCPEWLIKTGMKIASNCHGLPLAVVVIAGVLEKEVSQDYWDRIAESVTSYIVSDPNRYAETLALSFDYLPCHLRDCFLYLGGLSKYHKFSLRDVLWLWMAEGFIQEEENRSLEEIAEDYLIELADRNLVVVVTRKFDGRIKDFIIHDLLRELCLEKATKETFFLRIDKPMISHPFGVPPYKQRRIFTKRYTYINNYFDLPAPRIRSLLCHMCESNYTNYLLYSFTSDFLRSFPLLTVLDIRRCDIIQLSQAIALLVHLRHLAICCRGEFPSTICDLWSLQTLIVDRGGRCLYLPNTISNLVNLRHLWSNGSIMFPQIGKPINLQFISLVMLEDGVKSWVKCFPGIKKLTCFFWSEEQYDFESLAFLETLDLSFYSSRFSKFGEDKFRLPASLKKLTLSRCRLPWSDMSIFQSLPNLEVLKIIDNAFVGSRWDTGEDQFRQLKFLRLQGLDVQKWHAGSVSFPCLKRLALTRCQNLIKIPLELGDISTLELIEVKECSSSVVESLDRIQEEQQNIGNYELKINVTQQQPFDYSSKNLWRWRNKRKRLNLLWENNSPKDFSRGM